ncbi:hypothetical protein EZV62_026050 [Acer yangbiense]|uniref:Uncharacterized protein n=1 Tax=Acer yangbiense TaxID=1000413 RepID=A0A5C7GR95_9ROSI|nr:hypothetical protein EZV62_026050 [Acer yangbiense]
MAKVMASLRKTHESLSNSNLFNKTHLSLHPNCTRFLESQLEIAFQDNVSRFLRRETQYELQHFPSKQPASKLSLFTVHSR